MICRSQQSDLDREQGISFIEDVHVQWEAWELESGKIHKPIVFLEDQSGCYSVENSGEMEAYCKEGIVRNTAGNQNILGREMNLGDSRKIITFKDAEG